MFKFSWIGILVLILDQLSKWWAVNALIASQISLLPILKLVLVYNRGAAFGFLDEQPGWQNGLFIAIAIIVSVIILNMIRRQGQGELHITIALWGILGGAIGNVIDRIRVGAVVDFIQVIPQFPVFNLADSAITLGAVILVMDAFGFRLFWKKGK